VIAACCLVPYFYAISTALSSFNEFKLLLLKGVINSKENYGEKICGKMREKRENV
jgi:hypothetical protein